MIHSSLQNILAQANPNNIVSELTKQKAKIPSKDFAAKLKSKKKKEKVYLINNFNDLAWMEPFPTEIRELAGVKPEVPPKPPKGKRKSELVSTAAQDYDDGLCLG